MFEAVQLFFGGIFYELYRELNVCVIRVGEKSFDLL